MCCLGTSSLVKHSVGGVANTLQKTTGGVGTGLSLMTFDDRYQQERHVSTATLINKIRS